MRGPRYLPEPSLVEITVRTVQSHFLLRLTEVFHVVVTEEEAAQVERLK